MNQIAQLTSPIFGASKDVADYLLKVVMVLGFAVLTAWSAQASIPLPDTPVPVTLQTLSVTLAAYTLGPRLGVVSMLLYIAAAAFGAPVLADGASGIKSVIGATGGYLLGFVLVQPVMNLSARKGKSFAGANGLIVSLVVGNLVIFACGVIWLALWMGYGWTDALAKGLWPYLPGTLVKSGIAFILGFALVPWSCKRGW